MIISKPVGGKAELPRLITPSLLWAGGCVELELEGELVHSHFGMYAIKGSQRSVLIDTGHPSHAAAIEKALDEFVGAAGIDYIFPTHGEFPHFGLMPKWLAKYPQAMVVGDVRDYELYYPEHADRMVPLGVGGSIDLGDRKLVLVPAVWNDLKDTLWAFETGNRALFVADGFSVTHHHRPGTCGLTAGEQPPPDRRMVRLLSELALQWTRYMSPSETFVALDGLIDIVDPRYICPAHGSVIEAPAEMLPLIKQGMALPSVTNPPRPQAPI
jgi:flavorubredoxin